MAYDDFDVVVNLLCASSGNRMARASFMPKSGADDDGDNGSEGKS
jgi:hypothetical protein